MMSEQYKKRLEDSRIKYEEEVDCIAMEIFNDVVKPFCIKNGVGFGSGMGAWWFTKDNILIENLDRLKKVDGFAEVCDCLELSGLNNYDIGTGVIDFKSVKKSRMKR